MYNTYETCPYLSCANRAKCSSCTIYDAYRPYLIHYFNNEQCPPRQLREFTLSELAQYDGTMGKPAYVAVNGIVYDVSNISKWSSGKHHGLTAGKDLSSQFEGCHGDTRLAKLPKVGILKA